MEQDGKFQQQSVIAIIPARYGSTRLPGKMLMEIGGKPLILHTLGQCSKAKSISRVMVATDDQRIFDVVTKNGGEAVMTSSDHQSGSDRLAEVAETLPVGSIIVNVQGDEPMISPETIDRAVEALIGENPCGGEGAQLELSETERTRPTGRVSAFGADIVTVCEPITSLYDELLNFNVVKVVVGGDGYVLYFSRSPIPFPREASLRYGGPNEAIENEPELLANFRKHTGLYAYRREYLLKFTKLPPSCVERIEMLEQLRALENGAKIKVVEAASSSIGVDTEEDFERVKNVLEKQLMAMS